MNIRIERPTLNRPTLEENMALVDRWIADTADKLNAYLGNGIDGEVPTKLSELEDDRTHRLVTDSEKISWNRKADSAKAYLTDDTAGTTLSDADYVPFSSTSGKRKITWSNIKTVLGNVFAAITHTHTKSEITDFPSLATVATSGSYTDLSDKPTIPSGQIQSDWNQTNTAEVDFIKNKPTIPDTSTLYSTADSVTNLNLADEDYFPVYDDSASPHKKNTYWSNIKARLKTYFDDYYDKTPTLATVATSGSYSDLSNKPSLATVATSGSYSDLSNKPTIPSITNCYQTGDTTATTLAKTYYFPFYSGSAKYKITLSNIAKYLSGDIAIVTKTSAATPVAAGAVVTIQVSGLSKDGYKALLAIYGDNNASRRIFPTGIANTISSLGNSSFAVCSTASQSYDVKITVYGIFVRDL